MEHVEAVSEVEWNSFHGGMCSEEAGFMVQLLGNCSVPNELQNGPHYTVSTFWSANVNNAGNDEGSMYSSDDTNTNMYSFSHGGSYNRGSSSSICYPSSSHDSYYHDPNVPHQFLFNNGNLMKMDYYVTENDNNNETEGDDFLNQDFSNNSMESNETVSQDFLQEMNLGLKIKTPMVETVKEEKFSCPSGVSKRRLRMPAAEVQKSKRNTRQRKCAKVDDNDENISKNNDNAVIHGQSSSTCCSEDDSNASLELYGVNSSVSGIPKSGKTRTSRGSATDPQSLYARKRRERITERFKILQNLVPNGTKVDISTMLEEAVQYVKYLQLQIKLLSSNEHWMYAPLAYNGMDIGLLDLKISAPKS